MTPDRWERIKAVFHQATELPASERAAFVRAQCDSDADLIEQVVSLIQSHESQTISGIVDQVALDALEDLESNTAPTRIGPWR
ncbi:MAG: hypothetical protein AAGA68_25900, partial [Pseudomonadota bacterium]